MTSRLHELAIAALDDPDAAVVLGDWVLENKWFDARVMPLVNREQYQRAGENKRRKALWALAAGGKRTRKPSMALAKAIGAVVLFGEWPTPPWPATMLADARYTAVETTDSHGNIVVYRGRSPTFIPGEHPWPVMSRCYVETWREALARDAFGRAYETAGISLLSDENVPRGTLFGINREVDPRRLAGQRLVDVWTSQIDAAMAKLRRDLV